MAHEFTVATNGDHYFNIKAKNGQVVLSSQGYKSMSGAENGLESVKKNGGNKDNYEVKEAKDGRFYFVLKAANGQVVGKSQMYKAMSGVETGIASVMSNI